jgi:hypothetical protein
MKNLKWVSPILVTIKKIENIRAFVDYIDKNYHPLPFINDILNEVVDHVLYSFKDGYSGYNQIKIMNENILKMIFTTPWGTFAYTMMSFELCKAVGTFQRFMNKVLEFYIKFFVQMFLNDFCVYGNQTIHLHDLNWLFNQLMMVDVYLNSKFVILDSQKELYLNILF